MKNRKIKKPKIRVPVATKPNVRHKSKKDYKRNKKVNLDEDIPSPKPPSVKTAFNIFLADFKAQNSC